jgi:hypothetical protein
MNMLSRLHSLCSSVHLSRQRQRGANLIAFLTITSIASCAAMVLPQPMQHHKSHGTISKLIESSHIAYTSDNSTVIFIIGTSHFSSNSANEVKTLISAVNPDGVVLELDPERCLRLTKQSSGFDASGSLTGSREVVYGADFLSAINTCQELDIPLFLGDEYAQDTRERLIQSIGDMNAYSPANLIKSLAGESSQNKKESRIDAFETFRQDPQKLTPLIVTTSPPFALASVVSLFNNQHTAMAYDDVGSITSMFGQAVEIGAVMIASVLLSSLLFNNVIVERDKILANSTMRAAVVLKSLKEGRSIRKRWKFQAATQQLDNNLSSIPQEEAQPDSTDKKVRQDVPLFTLKTPIQKGMTRNLNLFEPRWLKMMDQLTSNAESFDNMKLGCVRCTNKFYSAIEISGKEGRYADAIFETIGNLAEVVDVKEGKRPVSGDRRLSVALRGGESFIVNDSSLTVCDDGYMIASDVDPQCLEHVISTLGEKNAIDTDDKVRIVVVVGLLHGNGVLSLLSKQK